MRQLAYSTLNASVPTPQRTFGIAFDFQFGGH